MKIKNAKIKNVTTSLDAKDNLIASIEFHEELTFSTFVFKLANPVELQNFTKLMEYAEVQTVNELEGKIIRIAEHKDLIRAIGHPIKDKFVYVTNKMTLPIEELKEEDVLKDFFEIK